MKPGSAILQGTMEEKGKNVVLEGNFRQQHGTANYPYVCRAGCVNIRCLVAVTALVITGREWYTLKVIGILYIKINRDQTGSLFLLSYNQGIDSHGIFT